MMTAPYNIRYKVFVPLLFVILALASCRNEANREIFEDLEGEEGVYMIKVPPALFLTMVENDRRVDSVSLGDIDFVKFLLFNPEQGDGATAGDMISDIKSKFYKYGYEAAIEFSSGGTFISAWILENEKYVSDIIILLKEEDSLIGLGLSGRLNGRAITDFASGIDYDDLKDLGNFSF